MLLKYFRLSVCLLLFWGNCIPVNNLTRGKIGKFGKWSLPPIIFLPPSLYFSNYFFSQNEVSANAISPNDVSPNEVLFKVVLPNAVSPNEVSPSQVSPNVVLQNFAKLLRYLAIFCHNFDFWPQFCFQQFLFVFPVILFFFTKFFKSIRPTYCRVIH